MVPGTACRFLLQCARENSTIKVYALFAKEVFSVSETTGSGQQPRLKVISREEHARRKREKRKKRIAFVVACVAIILIVVLVTVLAVKGIKKISEKKNRAHTYTCTAVQLEQVPEGSVVVNTGERIFVVGEGDIMCASSAGEVLWREKLGGDGYKVVALKDGLAVYAEGGNTIWRYADSGLVWRRSTDAPISNFVIGEESGVAIVCTEPDDSKSMIEVFKTKDSKTATETVLEKKYTSNYVLSMAVSPNGKTIAVGEIAEIDSAATTKISVIDVSTGRSFFSRVFENEVCPYAAFVGDDRLVVAGQRNIYIVENLKKNSAQSARMNTLRTMGDTSETVLAIVSADGKLVTATGNGEGRSEVRIYDLAGGSEKSFTSGRSVKALRSAGSGFFAVITQSDFLVYGYDGNLAASCEEKIDVNSVTSNGKGCFALSGNYGVTLLTFA